MNEIYVIQSASGNEYRLEFTTERSGLIAPKLLDQIFTFHNQISNVYNRVVVIHGVAEPYFFHIISRKKHLKYADIIADAHHKDFDK